WPGAPSRTGQAVLPAAGTLASGATTAAIARADDAAGSPQAVAQTSLVVVKPPPLTLGFTEAADPVRIGDQLEYVARFGNAGGAALLNTQLTVTLPPGTTVVDPGGGTPGAGTVTWALGALNPGQTGERPPRVRVDDLGATDPLVRVTRATIASGATAARGSVVTQVQPAAPLALVMTVRPEPVDPGQRITYTLTVTNRGAAKSDDVQIRMPIPVGVSGGCPAGPDRGTAPNGCATGFDILWKLGTVPAGTSRTVEAIFDPLTLADGTIVSDTARVVDAAGSRARAA